MNQTTTYPSPFYAQFEGATQYRLRFPVDEDDLGPYWLESGELIAGASGQIWERIEAVDLGAGRYRLACKVNAPFSGLRLNWGDEFLTEVTGRNRLRLLRVATPLAYRHYSLIVPRRFDNEEALAVLVHRFGGGWEAVAGGMLTLSVPAGVAADFARAAEAHLLGTLE
jgi:hypothetical protein